MPASPRWARFYGNDNETHYGGLSHKPCIVIGLFMPLNSRLITLCPHMIDLPACAERKACVLSIHKKVIFYLFENPGYGFERLSA